jgi:dolichol-phosphate mannosyltransferase
MSGIELSIIVPAFNEEKFLPQLLKRLIGLEFSEPLSYEIIVIDDASTDRTSEIFSNTSDSRVIYHRLERNSGKGAAVKEGIRLARGRLLVIQDADLEYYPNDIPALVQNALDNPGAIVYGSRVLGAKRLRGIHGFIRLWPKQSLSSYVFNFLLSFWIFCVKRKWITDSLTGYKIYPEEIFENWTPITNGFEMDHEITLQILNHGRKILENPISYAPRSKLEGKKIRPIDGLIAIKTVWKFRN